MDQKITKNIWDFACEHPIIFGMLIGSAINSTVSIIKLFKGDKEPNRVTLTLNKIADDVEKTCESCKDCKDCKDDEKSEESQEI